MLENKVYLKLFCPYCGSDGHMPDESLCPSCEGTKELDCITVIHLPTNVFYSHEVLEAIDTTEYDGLTGPQRDGVKMLLSCGMVDLNDGKAGKVRLWNWFGSESTTVADLTTLLI